MKEYFYQTYRKLGIPDEEIDKDWDSFVEDMNLQNNQENLYHKVIEYFAHEKEKTEKVNI